MMFFREYRTADARYENEGDDNENKPNDPLLHTLLLFLRG
jgi:hypothetical protein